MTGQDKQYQITLYDRFNDLAVIQVWAKNKREARKIATSIKKLIFNPSKYRRLWVRSKGRGRIKTSIEISGL